MASREGLEDELLQPRCRRVLDAASRLVHPEYEVWRGREVGARDSDGVG